MEKLIEGVKEVQNTYIKGVRKASIQVAQQ